MYFTPGCSACVARHDELRAAAEATVSGLEWQDVNALDNLDRAVDRGVLTLPAIVIDGEIAFTSMPTVNQLRKTLLQRSGRGA